MRNSELLQADEYTQLWLAVIALAVEDATAPIHDIHTEGIKGFTYTEEQWDKRRAHLWIQSKESGVGSLEWISTILGLSAEAIRDEYKRRLEARAVTEGQNGSSNRVHENGAGLHQREDRAAPDAEGPPTRTTQGRWGLLVPARSRA